MQVQGRSVLFPGGHVADVHRERDCEEGGEGADEVGPDATKGRIQKANARRRDGRGHEN